MCEEVKGTVTISADGTISIRLDNGSRGSDLFPNGIKSFLEVEIEMLQEGKGK